MPALVNRGEMREGNRKVLKILLGVVVFLVLVSITTIILKHRG
jgi:hypothetical protein